MFNSKQKTLINKDSLQTSVNHTNTKTDTINPFVLEALKQSASCLSGNGSLKYSTSGDVFLDQFNSVAKYRELRTYQEVDSDMRLLWSIDKEKTLALVLYIRAITRKVKFFDGSTTENVQKGQGLKHESIMRLLWLAINEQGTFWNNIELFVSVGSWNDIIQMLSYDLQYNSFDNKKLNWNKFADLLIAGLENPNASELIKKYLPRIRATSKTKTLVSQADTIIGKYLSNKLFDKKGYAKYRRLKSSGTAHEWQQLISKQLHDKVDFSTVHGRALAKLVSSDYLENQGLTDKYLAWIEKQDVVKYTGYVYELLSPVKSGYCNNHLTKVQEHTINKQFYGLVEKAKENCDTNSKFICCLDTSSSMTSNAPGLKISAYDVAKSVALFFSYLLEGHFKNTFFEFKDTVELKEWQGETPVQRLQNDRSEAYGSTNFLGIADSFISLKQKGILEKDFPTGVICISDGEFDKGDKGTNFEQFKNKLLYVGFSKDYVDNFKLVLWDIPNKYYDDSTTKFESFKDHSNIFYISGFDGSILTMLFGNVKNNNNETIVPKDAIELMNLALTQEIMQRIVV